MNIKRTLSALLAAAMLVTAAGCKKDSEAESTKKEEGKVTQVAFEAETVDTTEESLEFLKTKVPLFAKYLETRMNYPLTFETEISTADGGTQFAGIYIRDEKSVALSSKLADGTSERTIYADGKLHYIIDADKTVYTSDYSEDYAKDVVSSYLLTIDSMYARSLEYAAGTEDYMGTTYNFESVKDTLGNSTIYYFDTETDQLKYVIAGTSSNKVVTLNNEVNNEAFELPADYASADLNEYLTGAIVEQAEDAAASTEATE